MILDAIKSLLGIKSPSRAWVSAFDRRDRPSQTAIAAPWYAVRGPLDPYPSRELRDAARRVRRLVRRHWYALAFDPDGATATSVRADFRNTLDLPEKYNTKSVTSLTVEGLAFEVVGS